VRRARSVSALSGGRRRGPAPYVLLAILAALLAASQAVAQPSPSISAKEAEARQVVAEINQLNVSLDRSNELVNLANLRLTQVKHDIAVNRRELAIAKHNLAQSRRTIAKRLVKLYTTGTTSTLDVILGGRTLGEILDRIDTANRVSTVDAQVAGQVQRFQAAVLRHRTSLALENVQVQRLVAQRAAQRRAIEVRLGERRTLLDSLNGEVQRLIAAQQAAELRATRAAQLRAADVQSQATQTYAATAVGATAVTPEGAAVIPPSSHAGVAGVAMQYIGTPYVWAGSSPGGFDCSGLVMYAYSQVGVSLPHSSYAMWNDGVSVPRDQLQPGDIVFFDGLGHVGIYIGGGEFVHAPHTGTVVQVSSLDSGSYAAGYNGARRVS
jgi:cell wall-associated NlpC family hydrolase